MKLVSLYELSRALPMSLEDFQTRRTNYLKHLEKYPLDVQRQGLNHYS